MTAPWERYLSAEDGAVVQRARFGRRMGFGTRPAVLVIDAQRYMVGVSPATTQPGLRAAVPSDDRPSRRLTRWSAAAQAAQFPCFFTLFEVARDGSDMGVYRRKRDLMQNERWCLAGSLGAQMVPELVPADWRPRVREEEAERVSMARPCSATSSTAASTR